MQLVIQERRGYTLETAGRKSRKGMLLTCVQAPGAPGDPGAETLVLPGPGPVRLVVLDPQLVKQLGEEGAELRLTLSATVVKPPPAKPAPRPGQAPPARAPVAEREELP